MEFLDTSFLVSDELKLELDRAAEADPVRGWVPAYHFKIRLRDGTMIGRCDLRIGHNRNLHYGGNIGYGIFPDYRGHHCAEKACRLLFKLAKKHDLGYVIISCSPDNIPSRRTCERLGGELLEIAELPEDNDMRRDRSCTHARIYRYEL
ncbi:MAG: GNAT family N-acetyltransferase [Oscillospiraceae bacterium]|nr:GNAT family N-acetyltransferase [Oscillospiraceae bacterium]